MDDQIKIFDIPEGTIVTDEYLKNRFEQTIIDLRNKCSEQLITINRLNLMLYNMPASNDKIPVTREYIIKTMAQAIAIQNGEDMSEWEKYKDICENAINGINNLVRKRCAETAEIYGKAWGYQWPELGNAIADAIMRGE